MSIQWIYGIKDVEHVATSKVGGKAWGLMRLAKLGFSVPNFFVVSADALLTTVDDDFLRQCREGSETKAQGLRQRLLDSPLPPEIIKSIESAHASLFRNGVPVAVRSSAIGEDGQQLSFAGMYESVLGVQDPTGLISAIKQVWMSALNPGVLAYRRRVGLPPLECKIAVIVQEMIDAKCSGVCFTCDPNPPFSSDELIINSLFGLGEGLVSRSFAADAFRVNKQSLSVESEIVEKHDLIQLDLSDGGVRQTNVVTSDQRSASLSTSQLRQVAQASLAIESAFGQPQDIEFCFDAQSRLFVLQSRPITGTSPLRERRKPINAGKDNRIVWDNSNIIESYSGVTTPMTFSFIRRAYSIVYHCFAEVMGIAPQVVQQNRETFENMLGCFQGRVYYNLMNWYRLIGMFPGYHYNRHFMETMMGVKQSASPDQAVSPIGFWRRWFIEFPSLVKLLIRSGWNFLRIRTIVDRFQQHFYRDYDEWSKIDFDSIEPHEMAKLYDMMEQKMLWNWKAPIINDFFVMVFYGILKTLCVRWCEDESSSLQNGLVCGEGGLQSDEPAKLLLRITQLAKSDPVLRAMILNEELLELPQLISSDRRFDQFNELMSIYLRDFGLRCANELKLESYSYLDQPHRLFQMIRSYLVVHDDSICDLDAIMKREQRVRQAAEEQADRLLSKTRSLFPRRFVFRWVLKNARLGIRNRENMRFARTRIYGILRSMLRSVGRKFADQGILNDREDIFFLTIDEVWSYVRGTAVTENLNGLAQFRKTEFQRFQSESAVPPDDRFETFGLPYHDNSIEQRKGDSAETSKHLFTGTGCCPGRVQGTVQVVVDPTLETCFSGEILVAQRTDPGWVPYYPAFSGILVERGSLLSHSAIVAREMGIPTIVGIAGLTKQIRSGQRVDMDGSAGTVKVLPEG